jgi:hypothetical protein
MLPRNKLFPALALMALAVILPGGCNITIDDGIHGTDGMVTIRVINDTALDLDAQIYIASQVLPRNDLFKQSHKYTAFGVFDEGLLGPYGQETFTVDCADARAVGTTGGKFDNDSNTEESNREIILTQETVFLCGDVITFTYSRTNEGFTVDFDLN